MKTSHIIVFLLIVFAATATLTTGCYYDRTEDMYPADTTACDTATVSYAATISSILSTHCTSCHNASSASGGIDLSSYTALKAFLDQNESTFYGSIAWDGTAQEMPQGGNQLPSCDILKIKSWLNAGSPNN